METKTIVRIGTHLAELTPYGWKCNDPEIAFFCAHASHGSAASLPFYANIHRTEAELVMVACREEGRDAEIISLAGCDSAYSDPDHPNALF